MNCGIYALSRLMEHYNDDAIRVNAFFDVEPQWISLYELEVASIKLGYSVASLSANFVFLVNVKLPVIVFLHNSHYAMVKAIDEVAIHVLDETKGCITYSHNEFCQIWYNSIIDGNKTGIVMLIDKKNGNLPSLNN